MKTTKMPVQDNKEIQSRGEKLQKRIEVVIREMATHANKEGKPYVYNATQISKKVPTTRKTLAKHDEFVRQILDDLDARRRMVNGDATLELMREQIQYLKENIAEKDKLISSLRAHHIEIYKRFHDHSMEGELLIRPILESECEVAGKCLFCGTHLEKTKKLKRASNVTHISKGKIPIN